jgi:hypothetical protein
MQAQSGTQPSPFKIGISNQWATVFLRTNIEEHTKEADGESYTYWQYDEFPLQLRNRDNLEQFVTDNFNELLQRAREANGQEAFARLNAEVGQYLYSHYDQGTQASFLSLHADPATPQAGKDAIESVWVWIKSVMAYYYGVKNQLLVGDVVKWDFSQFDTTDPGVQLSDFMGQ